MAFRISVPLPGIGAMPFWSESRVLTTGPPGNSLEHVFSSEEIYGIWMVKVRKKFIPLSRELLTSSQWKSLSLVQLFVTPWNSPWNSPGQNTGAGSLSLLQGIFPSQGSNSGLPHCRRILYQLSYQEGMGLNQSMSYLTEVEYQARREIVTCSGQT